MMADQNNPRGAADFGGGIGLNGYPPAPRLNIGWVTLIGTSWKATTVGRVSVRGFSFDGGGKSEYFQTLYDGKAFVQKLLSLPLHWDLDSGPNEPERWRGWVGVGAPP
jgi:hypothetical protein